MTDVWYFNCSTGLLISRRLRLRLRATLVSPRLAQVPSQLVELGRFPTPANLISKHSVSALASRRKIELPKAREYA